MAGQHRYQLNRLPDDPTIVARPRVQPKTAGGPCRSCRQGNHHACTGVGCWRCPRENHRLTGQASRGDMSEVTKTRKQ